VSTLDRVFFIFHTLLIGFILVGWVWRKTRRLHLLSLILIAFSWFGLGLFLGIGYCPCTDWHWQVRASLGKTDLPHSYIKFLLDSCLGEDLDAGIVDFLTIFLYFGVFLLSGFLSWRDHLKRMSG